MVTIRKLFILIIMVLLLVGCGNTLNENVSKEMEQDTQQILAIFKDAIKEDRLPTEKENAVMEDYQLKYGARYNQGAGTQLELTQDEQRVYILTRDLIDMQDSYLLLDGEKESLESVERLIKQSLYD